MVHVNGPPKNLSLSAGLPRFSRYAIGREQTLEPGDSYRRHNRARSLPDVGMENAQVQLILDNRSKIGITPQATPTRTPQPSVDNNDPQQEMGLRLKKSTLTESDEDFKDILDKLEGDFSRDEKQRRPSAPNLDISNMEYKILAGPFS